MQICNQVWRRCAGRDERVHRPRFHWTDRSCKEQQARVVRVRRACYTFRDSRLVIRDIESLAEMNTIEEKQREAWGFSDLEIVPASELLVAREVGGCLIGAFESHQPAGFVYGLLGLDAGELSIHSDMLAVDPRYRGLNLGYGLKLAQRRAALERGIRRITWTFDPLLSLNAHLPWKRIVPDSAKPPTGSVEATASEIAHIRARGRPDWSREC